MGLYVFIFPGHPILTEQSYHGIISYNLSFCVFNEPYSTYHSVFSSSFARAPGYKVGLIRLFKAHYTRP